MASPIRASTRLSFACPEGWFSSLSSVLTLSRTPRLQLLSAEPLSITCAVECRLSRPPPPFSQLSLVRDPRPSPHTSQIIDYASCTLHSACCAFTHIRLLCPLCFPCSHCFSCQLQRLLSSRQCRTQILTGEPLYPHFPLADLYRFCRVAIPWHETRFTLLLIDYPIATAHHQFSRLTLRQVCIDLAPLCIQHLSAPTIILFP